MDTWVVSMPWLSWIILQQIRECRYLFEIVISFPSDIYPKVRLLDRMVVSSIFNFFRKPPCHFPYGLYQFKFLPTVHKGSLFQKGFKNLLFVGFRNFIKPLTSYIKINSKWIKHLNLRTETTKLIEENMGTSLHDFIFGNIFLHITPKYRQKKTQKIGKLDFIEIKKLLCIKGHYQENKKTIYRKRNFTEVTYVIRV